MTRNWSAHRIETKHMKGSGNLLQRIPLTIKMVLLTILLGGIVGMLTNTVVTDSVKEMFEKHVYAMLEKSSLENRIRFDNYLNNFRQLVKLFADHETLIHHIDDIKQVAGSQPPVRYQYFPEWFPGKSLMRSLATPRFFMIYSRDHALLEIYYADHEKNVPSQFSRLDPLTIDKTVGVTHITSFNGKPFILSSANVQSPEGQEVMLVFASPIDELFFLEVRGDFPQQLSGLLSPDKLEILTSSDTALLPPGTLIASINSQYLVHFHQYHEYGGAEMQIHFASFTPRSTVTRLTDKFMQKFNMVSIILITSIITTSALVMYAFSLRIERITSRVREFSLLEYGNFSPPTPYTSMVHGDEIAVLETSFTELIHEVERKTNQLQNTNRKLNVTIANLISTREELLKAEKLAVVGQMSGMVAHELLNPITSIAIRVEKNIGFGLKALKVTEKMNMIAREIITMSKVECDGEEQHRMKGRFNELASITAALEQNQQLRLEDLQFLDNELSKVVKIIDSFRQMARKERMIEDVNLVDVLKDVLDGQEDKLQKRKINLSVDIQPIPLIRGDFMEFHSIIANLVTNAVHAIENRKDAAERLISITIKPYALSSIAITISDTGIGITRENLNKVFEPSFTTKGRDGTGLGLAISRKIARSYKGDLVILESRINEGTTFQVLLGENTRDNKPREQYEG